MMAERPEIGPPEDFEHFQHVGVGDIESGSLDRDSNSLFLEVAERRRKKLPRTPKREKSASDARAAVSPDSFIAALPLSTSSHCVPLVSGVGFEGVPGAPAFDFGFCAG
jgi:hypothetical protein